MEARLRYLVYDPDKSGNERYYVRLKVGDRFKKARIRQPFKTATGEVSADFMVAYFAALAELRGEVERVAPKVAKPAVPRDQTFAWLFDQYYRSTDFMRLDIETQKDKRGVLGRFADAAGSYPYKDYRREDMERSQLARKDTPGAADKLVKVLRAVFNWAMKRTPRLMTHNPAVGIEPINRKKGGFHTWTPAEIDTFRAYWPVGSVPRLSLELMICIGARMSDAALIGPRSEFLRDGERWIRFTAYKGRNRYPVEIESRLTPDFLAALQATKTGGQTYILSARLRPYAIKSFGNAFKRWCKKAGIPHCSAHGLRKAASVAYAESGATAPELCAVFGWSNLRTAQIYIEKAEKRKLRANAYERRQAHENGKSVSTTEGGRGDETIEGKEDGKSTTLKRNGGR